jgi:hypothetical protein
LIQHFNNNVEKTLEEEIKEYEQRSQSDKIISPDTAGSKSNNVSNNRFQYDVYMNTIKVKTKTKEDLKQALSQNNTLIQQMKLDLELKSKQLLSFNSSTQFIPNDTLSPSQQIQPNDSIALIIPDHNNNNNILSTSITNISSYLELRESILQLSNQIETSEAEYRDLSNQYSQIESEITESLVNTPFLNLNNTVLLSDTTSEPPQSATPVHDSSIGNKGFWKVEGGVTIVDVLSGKANIYRMNGM